MQVPARPYFISIGLLSIALASSSHAARWVELSPADTTRPLSRAAHSVVLDAPGRRLIAWGPRLPADQVWALPLDGPAIWGRLRVEGEIRMAESRAKLQPIAEQRLQMRVPSEDQVVYLTRGAAAPAGAATRTTTGHEAP